MIFNPTTKTIILSESEQGVIMKAAHTSPLTTVEVLARVLETWSANLEQDVADALNELRGED